MNARPAADLCGLSHLHEAAVLANLQARWPAEPYTFISVILVAVNPVVRLKPPPPVGSYAGQAFGPDLPPHPYALAELALTQLPGGDQSIVISGESGSGKTESAKILLAFLCARASAQEPPSQAPPHLEAATEPAQLLARAPDLNPRPELTPEKAPSKCDSPGTALADAGQGPSSGSGRLDERILASNPIFEAFGNAKTLRNGNSSRFGKFIKLLYLPSPARAGHSSSRKGSFTLVGAQCETYLLEKSRAVAQSPGERNFHAFFQVGRGACSEPWFPAHVDTDTCACIHAHLPS